jgi:MraZ protein
MKHTKEGGMSTFGGSAAYPMDAKGRVSLPAKYRRMLPDDLVIRRSPDRDFPALCIYSKEAYDAWAGAIVESQGGYRASSASQAQLMRKLYAEWEPISCDQAGRLLIPQHLRHYAELMQSVMILGVYDHIEIWSPEILARCNEFYDKEVAIFDQP